MNTELFDFVKLHALFNASPAMLQGKKYVKTVSSECQEYIGQYFFQSTIGNYYMWDTELKNFVCTSYEIFNRTYLKKFPVEAAHWFERENYKLYTVVCDINKPRIHELKLNSFAGFPDITGKIYANYSDHTKECVQVFLDYMLDILCSGNKEILEYLINWTATICQGKKNDTALYLKGPEGIGKSTYSSFLLKNVLGPAITTKAKPDVLTGLYNKILCGKVLVVFEEIPTFSTEQWNIVSSNLKDMITDKMYIYCEKYEKSIEAENVNSYIINTNVDAIKNSEGRRWMTMPVSTAHKEDHVYFGKIDEMCTKNKECAEAFFVYMKERDISKWGGQKDMPDTVGKLNAIAERLAPEFKFLKEQYVFQHSGLDSTARDMYDKYKIYCIEENYKPLIYLKFTAKLAEININYKKSCGIYKYKMSYVDLKAYAKKYHWIHELDEFDESVDVIMPKKKSSSKYKEEDTEHDGSLRDEIAELKARLAKFEMMERTVTTVTSTISKPVYVYNDFDVEEAEPAPIIMSKPKKIITVKPVAIIKPVVVKKSSVKSTKVTQKDIDDISMMFD